MNFSSNACTNFKQITDSFILSGIAFFGILLNILCVIIFSNSKLCKKSKENAIFKFLLVKSICDILVLLECLTKLFVQCKACSFAKTYFICLLSLLTEDYFKQVFRMLSILCQTFSALLVLFRLKSISFGLMQSHTIQLLMILFLVFIVMFFYIYEFFEEEITEISVNSGIYELVKTDFRYSRLNFYITLTQGIFRDLICVFIIFVINVFVLIEFNRIIKRKRILVSLNSNNSSRHFTLKENRENSARQNEKKQKLIIKMVFVSSIQTSFGHIPLFFKYFSVFKENKCFVQMSKLLYVLSVSTNFFIYYFFNNVFKNNVQQILSNLFS